MKKAIMIAMVMALGLPVSGDAAQAAREFNNPEQVRRAIDKQQGLKRIMGSTAAIEAEIELLGQMLKEMEGQEGIQEIDFSEQELHDPAGDPRVIHPKIGERPGVVHTEQEEKASGDETESVYVQAAIERSLRAEAEDVEQEENKAQSVLSERAQYGADVFGNIVGIKDLGSVVMGYDRDPWADKSVEVVSRVLKGHRDWINSVAVTPDGKQIVTGSSDGTARVWDIKTGNQVRVLKGHGRPVSSVAVTPDGKRVVTQDSMGTARVWDIKTGNQVRVLEGREGLVYSVAVTPDGKYVVAGSDDGQARVWDVATGEQVQVLKDHEYWVNSVAVTPDGKRLVTGFDDRIARVWDIATGDQVKELKGHEGVVNSVAITPNGKFIVTGSSDGTARVWDIATGDQVMVLNGYEGPVYSVAVTPDGKQVVTGSYDETARVWDIATGNQVRVLKGHGRPVSSVAVTPDGKRIVTGSWDKTARVWSVEPPVQESVNERLIALVHARIDAGPQTPEQEEKEGNVKRALAAIKILVEQGANPAVLVPTDGGGHEPLWQLAARGLGLENPIVTYLKRKVIELEAPMKGENSLELKARRTKYFSPRYLRAIADYLRSRVTG